MATAVGANKGPGGHRDERAADLVLLGLNYSLEKAEIKKQEAPTVVGGLECVCLGGAFPFFIPFFLSLCLMELSKHPLWHLLCPTQRGGPRIRGCPAPLCWMGCQWHPWGWDPGNMGPKWGYWYPVVLCDSQVGKSCPGEMGGEGLSNLGGVMLCQQGAREGWNWGVTAHKLSISFRQVQIQNRDVNPGMAPA